jgi:hypothetical protein
VIVALGTISCSNCNRLVAAPPPNMVRPVLAVAIGQGRSLPGGDGRGSPHTPAGGAHQLRHVCFIPPGVDTHKEGYASQHAMAGNASVTRVRLSPIRRTKVAKRTDTYSACGRIGFARCRQTDPHPPTCLRARAPPKGGPLGGLFLTGCSLKSAAIRSATSSVVALNAMFVSRPAKTRPRAATRQPRRRAA